MTHKTSPLYDPLNLVRVPSNPLQREARTVMHSIQQQKISMKNLKLDNDDFEDVEKNLDKWKQKRHTSFSKSSMELSPSLSFPIQPNFDNKSAAQLADKQEINSRFKIEPKTNSPKLSAKVSKSSKEMLPETIPYKELVRKKDISSQLENNRNIEKPILRSKPSILESNKRTDAEPLKSVSKDYVRKSENRFKNAKAFFEQTHKPADDNLVKAVQKSTDVNKLNKRRSWAPGMIDKAFNVQSQGKLSIANDKEFIIEEIDFNKPRTIMGPKEVRGKSDKAPRFVPNIETKDDEILRKKSLIKSNSERKSRTEIISVDFGDKSAPNISLDDFKSIITSPQIMDEEITLKTPKTEDKIIIKKDTSKEEKTIKASIGFEDKIFQNKMVKDSKFETKIILEENKNIADNKNVIDEKKNEKLTSKKENIFLKNDFLKEKPLEATNFNKEDVTDRNNHLKGKNLVEKEHHKDTNSVKSDVPKPSNHFESTFSQFEIKKDIQKPIKINEIRYEPACNDNITDALKKRMEERKAVFKAGFESKDEKHSPTSFKIKKNVLNSIEQTKDRKIEPNPLKEIEEFEATFNKHIDEIKDRKTKDSKESSLESFENRLKLLQKSQNESKEKKMIQIPKTEIKSKSENLFAANFMKKTEEEVRIDLNEKDKKNNVTFNAPTKTPFIVKSNAKIDFKKELHTDIKSTKVRSMSTEDDSKPSQFSVLQTDKAVPKVAPKPTSKTNMIKEKLTLSGFTPVKQGSAIPRRSKSMKTFRMPMSTVVVVDEVGVDMEEEFSSNALLDHSAQKSKSALARNVRRRPPTFFQTRISMAKTQTFDCSNGYGLEVPDDPITKRLSCGNDDTPNEAPFLPSRPPPDAPTETRTTLSNSNPNLISDPIDHLSNSPESFDRELESAL